MPFRVFSDRESKNKALYVLVSLLYTVGYGLCAEGYLQAYMLQSGLSAAAIGLYGSVTQLSALAAYAIFAGYAPKNGSYRRAFVLSSTVYALYPVGFLIMGVLGGNTAMILGAMLMAAAINGFMGAFRFACENCVVPLLFARRDYGVLLGKSGMIGSALATAISLIGASVLSKIDAMIGYRVFFAIAAGALMLAACLVPAFSMELPQGETAGKQKSGLPYRRIFTKQFMILLLPHFLRGISEAGIYYFVVVALLNITLSTLETSLIVTVGVAASMLGNFLLMFFSSRLNTGKLVQRSIYLIAACMILVVFTRVNWLFFALYFVFKTAVNVMGNAVPVGVMRATPLEDMPLVTPVRMFVLSGTNSLCTLLFGALFERIPALCIMGFTAATLLTAGFFFRRQFTDAV